MKLIKIGSDSSCDIVINSDFVSAHHADITLLDDGSIILEDKNSTNGTVVGNKKVTPGQEVPVRRGDLIKFADETLVWARVPSIENNSKYKRIINIGSNYRNNIVLNNPAVSRYHAALKIEKSGRAFIIDNGSKNGTQVNGMRIAPGKLTRVKRGDNVLCGGEDITEQLKMFLPQSISSVIWISAASIAIIALIGWALSFIIGGFGPDRMDLAKSVVYVRAAYHYEVQLNDNPLTDANKDYLVKTTAGIPYQATAFFLDRNGVMATNRHVAKPWAEEYRGKEMSEVLAQGYQEFLNSELPAGLNFSTQWNRNEAARKLSQTGLGQILLSECQDWRELAGKYQRLTRATIVISGELDYITVGYPGQRYQYERDFATCDVICESGDKEIDLALLQLNNKKTPGDIKQILDPTKIYTGVISPLKDDLFVIGYPNGITWNMDDHNELSTRITETKCSRSPDQYKFEFNAVTQGGSSGSPVFDKKGRLFGVLSNGYTGTSVTFAVLAAHLQKMYDSHVASLKQTK